MNVSEQINQLSKTLKKDRTLTHPQYPDQAVYVLEDERVVKALEARFARNQTLTGICPQGYNFFTGMISLCFAFTPHGALGLVPDGILVIVNQECRVVAVIEPFNATQPNSFMPPLRRWGEEPFVLAQQSAAPSCVSTTSDLKPRQERCREFFEEIGLPKGVYQMPIGPRGGVGDDHLTSCQWTTEGNCGIRKVCMQGTGFFAWQCDYWDTEFVPDAWLDGGIDDSGFGTGDDFDP
jgi:hypothetical protein